MCVRVRVRVCVCVRLRVEHNHIMLSLDTYICEWYWKGMFLCIAANIS